MSPVRSPWGSMTVTPIGEAGEGADEVEQERALARARRAEDREVAGEGVGRQGEVAHRGWCPGRDRRLPGMTGGAAPERAHPGEPGAVEGGIGQGPQLRELPVGEPGGWSGRRGTPVDLPADRLGAVVEGGGEADQPPQQRLRGRRRDARDLERERDVEADHALPAAGLGVALRRREASRRALRRGIRDRMQQDGVGDGPRRGTR